MTRAQPYYFQIIENSNGASPALTRVSSSNFFVTKLLEIRTLILNFISNFLEIHTFIVSIIKRLILNEPMVQPFYWVLDLKKNCLLLFLPFVHQVAFDGVTGPAICVFIRIVFHFQRFHFPLILKTGRFNASFTGTCLSVRVLYGRTISDSDRL